MIADPQIDLDAIQDQLGKRGYKAFERRLAALRTLAAEGGRS